MRPMMSAWTSTFRCGRIQPVPLTTATRMFLTPLRRCSDSEMPIPRIVSEMPSPNVKFESGLSLVIASKSSSFGATICWRSTTLRTLVSWSRRRAARSNIIIGRPIRGPFSTSPTRAGTRISSSTLRNVNRPKMLAQSGSCIDVERFRFVRYVPT